MADHSAHQQACPPDKLVLVIIDGVGDVTIPAFGDMTPLQVAHTPNLDCIAGVRAVGAWVRAWLRL
jgi:2,3-bisphosphoglycerate-independent phosphoglycerate mutase